MPWSVGDVEKFKKGLTPKGKRQWVATANSARARCLQNGGSEKSCDARAVRIANGVTEMDMTEKEKQDRLYEEFPNVARETIDVALKENDFNFARIILAIEHEDNGDTTLGATGFYAGKVIK